MQTNNEHPFLQVINDPGKFEGEMEGIRMVWEEFVMSSFEDEIVLDGETAYSIFLRDNVNHQGVILETLFASDPDCYAIALMEDEQGFVNSYWLTESEYNNWIKNIELRNEDNED